MIFPFVAVEGQEKIKKALLLNIINPKIGGVLINGEKGTAKSTLVRGIGEVFPEIKIVNLPLNITEDNLLGSLDIEKTLKTGKKVFQDGLLKKCHNNILYIDEVNLLGDSIISNILEVASREINYIEREGISISHQCKFVLIGTMNPEEGGLRPQLLDKFGLYVNVEGSDDILERVKIIKKRLEFEDNPRKFCEKYKEDNEALREKIFRAKERLSEIKASEQIINIAIKIVEEAVEKSIEGISTGVLCSDIDKIARNHIEEAGYGQYFNHSLGHGVGIDVHEMPVLRTKSDTILEDNMVFTIEPGIYLPNKFGVRIEETVLVKNGKAEIISNILDKHVYNILDYQ